MTGGAAGGGAPAVLPHGAWPSPLSPSDAAAGAVRFAGVRVGAGPDGTPVVRWVESRPDEGGRAALVRWWDGATTEVGPAGVSCRSLVNEYGGGSWWAEGDSVWWVEAGTQLLFRTDDPPGGGSTTVALTPPPPRPRAWRWAAGRVTPDGRWLVVEREAHTDDDGDALDEPVNDLAAVAADGSGHVVTLVRDGDFVAAPALSPDGGSLAWLRWDHPDMPWDSAELWAGRLVDDGDGLRVVDRRRVAGGAAGGEALGLGRPVAACLPEWGPDGRLWWCDDATEWWHLKVAPAPGLPEAADGTAPLVDEPEEVGEPRWVSGGQRYGVTSDGRVVHAAARDGLDHVWVLDPATGARSPLPGPRFAHVEQLHVSGDHVALVAGSPTVPTSVWLVDLRDGTTTDLRSTPAPLPAGAVSVPEPVTVPVDGESVHGLLYPPRSELAAAPDGELPPLVIRIHGGPTASARPELSTSVQFWTTRGFAVVEVNYRGSTGYGRRYRDRLRGSWGLTDVADCLAMAEGLARAGRVAPGRALIRGGSAGGFTTLAALCADGERVAAGAEPVLAGGCSLYGVTDLAALAAETHKFESRYLDGLVGPLPGAEATYARRSPLANARSIRAPVLLLQGALDPVVPLEQAEVLAAALAEGAVPHALLVFPDEAHGFRSAESIVVALEAELAFAGQVVGVTPADDLPPLDLTP